MNDLIKWTNEATANVAKWIDADPCFYNVAKNCQKGRNPFRATRSCMKLLGFHKTPDQVSFWDPNINMKQINSFIKDL